MRNKVKKYFIFILFSLLLSSCGPDQLLSTTSPHASKATSTRASINYATFTSTFMSTTNNANTIEFTEEIQSIPTQSLPILDVLSHSSYIDSTGFHIVGEVRNNFTLPMKDVVISAILYNDSGEVVGSGFTLSLLIVIPPGEKSPFNINIDKWEGETNYKLQAEGHNASMPRQDIIITVNKSKIIGKWLHILGEIKNISTTNAFYVEIIVTLYNDSNNVIGCGYSLSNIEIISPGGTSPFDVSTNHWDGFDHYDIQIQAKYQAE